MPNSSTLDLALCCSRRGLKSWYTSEQQSKEGGMEGEGEVGSSREGGMEGEGEVGSSREGENTRLRGVPVMGGF